MPSLPFKLSLQTSLVCAVAFVLVPSAAIAWSWDLNPFGKAPVLLKGAIGAPVINSFSSDKSSVQAGEPVTLTAVFANGVGVLTPGNLPVVSGVPFSVSPNANTTYRLSVKGSKTTVNKSITVAVASGSRWVMGYYVVYAKDQLPPSKIDWEGLTHITVGVLKANPDGTLAEDFDIGDNGATARQIGQLAHANGKKALLMLGGSGEGAKLLAAVRDNRPKLVANLVQLLSRYGFDGIDLDWEDNMDLDLFALFARDLRQALPNALITIPVNPVNGNIEEVDARWASIAKYVDQVNLMSYSPATGMAGQGWLSWHNSPLKGAKPSTPITIEDSLARYARVGIPKSKLGMGSGHFAMCYDGAITGPNQVTETGVQVLGDGNEFPISDLYGPTGSYSDAHLRTDSVSQNSYLSLPQVERHGCKYVSFDDEAALLAKGAFSRENGYGGVIVWNLNNGYIQGHPQPMFLMRALMTGFITPTVTPQVHLSIMQGPSSVAPGQTKQFNALVSGTPNKAVTWTVSGRNCGTVSKSGLYRPTLSPATCVLSAKHTASSKTTSVPLAVAP